MFYGPHCSAVGRSQRAKQCFDLHTSCAVVNGEFYVEFNVRQSRFFFQDNTSILILVSRYNHTETAPTNVTTRKTADT